jgi:hypothetical protein
LKHYPFSDIVYIREETAGERTLLSAAAVEHALKVICYARALATGNEHTLDVKSLWIKTKNFEKY